MATLMVMLLCPDALAQSLERQEVLPLPAATEATVEAVPAADQPFGTTSNLPEGYKPSPSAIDPAKPDPSNPADSPLPPSYQEGEGLPAEVTDGMEVGPPPPDIITAQPDPRTYIAVQLQGLDKVTARRQQFDATMGTVTSFGNLEIVPRACWQSPAEDKPDSAALLEIWQWKPGEKPSFVFFGWMFSSSPGLSSLEHPIYDLTVLKCKQDPKEAKAEKKRLAQEEKEAKEAARKAAHEAAQQAAKKEAQNGLTPAPQEEVMPDVTPLTIPKEDINAPQPD